MAAPAMATQKGGSALAIGGALPRAVLRSAAVLEEEPWLHVDTCLCIAALKRLSQLSQKRSILIAQLPTLAVRSVPDLNSGGAVDVQQVAKPHRHCHTAVVGI